MHIKDIHITNFRSFKQQGGLDPTFHPGTNCIIGRNGSGKSNLLDAVQFCLLSPRFANLRQEERQALLHEGSGNAALNSFVELVIDNTDHRLNVDDDEVVIRRVIGLKKDEMFLQRKRVTKQAILSLLEGAGFSKSNPYFLVQQGRIQSLCLMNDAERLAVLKEVAGTIVFDNKKLDSLAKIQDNKDQVDKVQEMLERNEERLSNLKSETEELEEFTQADKQRRGCEYCLYESEMDKTKRNLMRVEEERAAHTADLAEMHDKMKSDHVAIQNLEGQIHSKNANLRQSTRHISLLEQDMKDGMTKKTRLALECKELESQLHSAQQAQELAHEQLQKVQKEIDATEAQLRTLSPQLSQEEKELSRLQQQRLHAETAFKSLHGKQMRAQQFTSKEERDAHLNTTLTDLTANMNEAQAQLSVQRDHLASTRRSIQSMEQEVKSLEQELDKKASALTNLSKNLNEKLRERQTLHENRKSDWRSVETLREELRDARESWQTAKGDSRKSMPKATSLGLEALAKIIEEEGLTSDDVYGTVLENITLKQDKYATAIDVAAQNSLFHVIVRDDEVAALLMQRLEKDKLGRVTFLPLNQLRVDDYLNAAAKAIPPSGNSDVCFLLDACVTYDPKVTAAMKHVFGRKLLARSQQAASEWGTKCNMDAITLDGDLVARKGAVSGGYVDTSKSRWVAHVKLQRSKTALDDLQGKYREASRHAELVDQQSAVLTQDIQKGESKQAFLSQSIRSTETSLERLQTRLEQQRKNQEKLEKSIILNLERQIENLQAEKVRIEGELNSELIETLTAEDKHEVERLKSDLARLEHETETQEGVVATIAAVHHKATSFLKENLLKRKAELVNECLGDVGDDDEDDELDSPMPHSREDGSVSTRRRRSSILRRVNMNALQEQRKLELEERQAMSDLVTNNLAEIEDLLTEQRQIVALLRSDIHSLKDELEQIKSTDLNSIKTREEALQKSEKLLTKRTALISRKEFYTQKIQELGSLPPPSELRRFQGKSLPELTIALDAIKSKLRNFSHVNKKALDQYVSYNEHREALLTRQGELERGSEEIKELIEDLDLQKDEAINRTFRGVSAHFKAVFSELVPSGAGELIIRTALAEDRNGANEGDKGSDKNSGPSKTLSDPNNPDVSLYRGVGIKVRFSEVGENYMMSQLSGGQKALVAMALIFAIQRCDPAPFYIFDELDQALDSSYRAAVASLIERQASSEENPTQFIVTTFRPELVSVASNCYGISLQNKVSNLHNMSKVDALTFVASLLKEEEAVGEVSAMASSRHSLSSRKRKLVEIPPDGSPHEEGILLNQ